MKHDRNYSDAALFVFSRRELPARCDVKLAAKILGFPDHAIPVLVQTRKLIPLGRPTANAPKFFATIEVLEKAVDRDWLAKASQVVSDYWSKKNQRQRSQPETHLRSEQPLQQEATDATMSVCFSGSI